MPLLFLLALIVPLQTFAGEALYARSTALTEGSVISVYLDPTANVNAVEGVLKLPEGSVVKEVRTGGSVVQYWLETPFVQDGSIPFSGMIPGGFSGTLGTDDGAGLVLSVVLEGSAEGATLTGGAVYQHDGSGTRLAVADSAVSADGVEASPEEDGTAPEWARAIRLREDGRTFLILSGVDKGSGIAYFEVAEGFGAFVRTSNPYELTDAHGLTFARVRVVDNAKNIYEFVVWPAPVPLTAYLVVLITILGLLYWKQHRSRRHV